MKKIFLSITIVLLAVSYGHCATDPQNAYPFQSYKIATTLAGKDKLPKSKEVQINALNTTEETIDISLHLGPQEPDLTQPASSTPYTFDFTSDGTEQLVVDAALFFTENIIVYSFAFNGPNVFRTIVGYDKDWNLYYKSPGNKLALWAVNNPNRFQIYPIALGEETLVFQTSVKDSPNFFSPSLNKKVTINVHVLPAFQPKTDAPVVSNPQ